MSREDILHSVVKTSMKVYLNIAFGAGLALLAVQIAQVGS